MTNETLFISDQTLIEPTDGFEIVGYTKEALHSPVYKNCVPFKVDPPESFVTRRLRAKQILEHAEHVNTARDYFLNVPNIIWDLGFHTSYDGLAVPNVDKPTSWQHIDIFTSQGSHPQMITVLDIQVMPSSFDVYVLRDEITKRLLLLTIFRNNQEENGELINPSALETEAIMRRTAASYYSYYKFIDRPLLIPNRCL